MALKTIPKIGEVRGMNESEKIDSPTIPERPVENQKKSGSRKKWVVVLVLIILVGILGLSYFRGFIVEEAEVPTWKVGDNWIYNSSFQGDLINGTDIGIIVKYVSNFKNTRFYQIAGHIDPMFDDRLISADDLNPIILEDYENGTFSETDRPYDFPLYKGKEWEFTTSRNHSYKYVVESVGDVIVLGGTYLAYKIRKTEGNKTVSITYYSPKVKNIVKMVNYYGDSERFRLYQLKSFSNEPFERLIDTQQLNNRYNATLETWEERYSPVDDWILHYRVKFTENGEDFLGYFSPEDKFHLDWIINNTNEDETILCWWDYGNEIKGYTGRKVVIDGPSTRIGTTLVNPWDMESWNKDSDVINVSRALVGTPEETIEIMKQYDATLIYLKSRELVLSPKVTGIFPVIVDAAQWDLDHYYEIFIRTSSGKIIKSDEYQYDPSNEIVEYWIEFKDAYYGSMIYRARFGFSGDEISPDKTLEGLPEISEDLRHYPIMPCWNQANFKVVFRTARWNPYPVEQYKNHTDAWQVMEYLDAVDKIEAEEGISDISGRSNVNSGSIILRYFEGAILSGKITDVNGTPSVGVNITVTDEYGVPHQMDKTDESGNYSLIVPFGNLKITISQGEVDGAMLIGDILLERNMTVELYQATREEVDYDDDGFWDYYIFRDFEIPS
ncbi:MAG: hypothetical protein JSV09_07610 [Thermoplasmata archaeon]|nr:MAG: hypothetical protein JSV09_07610 [Thermoplasmata archaeon]